MIKPMTAWKTKLKNRDTFLRKDSHNLEHTVLAIKRISVFVLR